MAELDLADREWQICERHCRRFEAAWHDGVEPSLEAFLPLEGDSLRDSVLRELVHLDLEFRLRAGYEVRVEDYLCRFPEFKDRSDFVLELIEEEFALRQETDHAVSPTEYIARFPPLALEVHRRLSVERSGRTSVHASSRKPTAGETMAAPRLPGCEILEVLGRGGMGIVYKARQLELGRLVAVKMIRAGIRADEEERRRFQREVRAAAALQHPNIVQIYEVGEFEGLPYCILEYVPGGSLQRRLAAGPLTPHSAAALLAPLARAMHFAHEHGVVHRDLKPANILLFEAPGPDVAGKEDTATGFASDGSTLDRASAPAVPPAFTLPVPKVADFGLAKRIEQAGSLTESGAMLGTVQYMAPEQADGRPAGAAADIYSFGAILYEMLTGRPPLQGASAMETLELLRNQEPIPPTRLQPKTPRDLETICLKCLEKDPGRRYVSAEALADDTERFLAGEPIHACPISPVARLARWCRRKPALASVSALASGAVFTVMVVSTVFALVKNNDAQKLDQAKTKLENEQKETKKALEEKTAELIARQKAEAAKAIEEKARRRFNRLSAMLSMERGLKLCDDGDVRHGLMWLTRSLEILPEDSPDLEFVLRSNLAAWRTCLGDIRAFLSHEDSLGFAQFSPDGRFVLTRGVTNQLRLWDAVTGEHLGHVTPAAMTIGVAFSPEGNVFTILDRDLRMQLFDTKTCKALGPVFSAKQRLTETNSRSTTTVIHPDGKTILRILDDKLQFWNGRTGEAITTALKHPTGGRILVGAFSADGATATTVSWDFRDNADAEVCRWNPATGQQIQDPLILPHGKHGQDAVLSPDGRFLLTLTAFGKLACWDLQTAKPIVEFASASVRRVGFFSDGKHFFLARDIVIHRWETVTGKRVEPPFRSTAGDICFAPNSNTALLVERNTSRVSLVDLLKGKDFLPSYPYQDILAENIGPDGHVRLVVRTSDKIAHLVDYGPADRNVFPRAENESVAMAAGPGRGVLIKPADPTRPSMGQLWSVQKNAPLGEPFSCVNESVFFDDAEQRVLVRGTDQKLRLFDAHPEFCSPPIRRSVTS